ncbi:SDR family oxidoreductase [Thiocystis violascens]|uniref:Nucleoside-diphosphate-sugar epimerase n=1 Tax=Thiocystis violascens (strain ATCC 17096 / DSM 198 / 6111) TaxID=765911 RepID=I3YFE2_THIV6|nr:SDR family oxidoreductase [Thiocystis violascens]AFL75710.1 nucleoside-diphosphate-sugar epimerase [Thiocystis violascens DSM 198]
MAQTIIVGCGYVGTRLARQSLDRGASAIGLTRSEAGLARLVAAGVPARRYDLFKDDLSELGLAMAGAELFHLAPPPEQGVEDPRTRRLIASFEQAGQPRRIVYISTTGVYGDCQGGWVDETRPAQPTADRSRRRWDAEQALRAWSQASGGELVILRVAGIYGPDRLPLERIRQGAPLVRVEEAPYTNRIHVEDLVSVCLAAMEKGADGAVYNACDGAPSTMTDYFLAVADAAGLPRPPCLSLAEASERLSAGMLSYLAESRRLSNRKLREELGVAFRYPTLADGLRGVF